MLLELSISELTKFQYKSNPPGNDLRMYNLLGKSFNKGKYREVAKLFPFTYEEGCKKIQEFVLKYFYLKDGNICPKRLNSAGEYV